VSSVANVVDSHYNDTKYQYIVDSLRESNHSTLNIHNLNEEA